MPEKLYVEISWSAHYYKIQTAQYWVLQYIRHMVKARNAFEVLKEYIAHEISQENVSNGCTMDSIPPELQFLVREVKSLRDRKKITNEQILDSLAPIVHLLE